MDPITHHLNAMINHQRQAKRATDAGQQDYHHREAMRYRAMVAKLEKQGRVLRQFVSGWLNLN